MSKTETGTAYKEVSHTWFDIWEDRDIAVSYRFAKPTAAHMKRLQATAAKNAEQASRNLLLDTIHPDDKDKFLADLESYPVLTTTFAGYIITACGAANLGNG
jgi:hypothetical protein